MFSLTRDAALLARIKNSLVSLEALLAKVNSHWTLEDGVYRYYHQSFKVYGLQSATAEMVEAFSWLSFPERGLNEDFMAIAAAGTGQSFTPEANRAWAATTRPLVEAFFHARYFLEMIVRYGRELDAPPQMLPSGWAAVLYLFQIR
jgi:hypothetical protein